jgi:hypothetical protein
MSGEWIIQFGSKNKVNGRLLSKLYFTQAMQYFREKYQNVAFVVASDDRFGNTGCGVLK